MNPTTYACFVDIQTANSAVIALKGAGLKPEDLTLASKAEGPAAKEADQEVAAMSGAFPDLRSGGQGGQVGDEAGYGMRYSNIAATANASVEPGVMTDYLWDALPDHLASYYREQYNDGHAVLIVRNSSETALRILREHAPMKLHSQ
ncbi:MAG TPA: hypothetical protein VHE55_02050 [Fimbriimonadaceae bacterium]|nr:hypothetical protein [Fimbriimonadaceae bacterium]